MPMLGLVLKSRSHKHAGMSTSAITQLRRTSSPSAPGKHCWNTRAHSLTSLCRSARWRRFYLCFRRKILEAISTCRPTLPYVSGYFANQFLSPIIHHQIIQLRNWGVRHRDTRLSAWRRLVVASRDSNVTVYNVQTPRSERPARMRWGWKKSLMMKGLGGSIPKEWNRTREWLHGCI